MAKPVKKQTKAKTKNKKDIRSDIVAQAKGIDKKAANDKKSLSSFLNLFFQGETLEDIEVTGCFNCFNLANSLWKNLQKRRENSIYVKVYNPSKKQHGWASEKTVIEIIQKDTPFIIASVLEALRGNGYNVHRLFHPIIRASRDDQGNLVSIHPNGDPAPGLKSESIVHLQIDKIQDKSEIKRIESVLKDVLDDVWTTVHDWKPMEARLADTISDLQALKSKKVKKTVSEDVMNFLNFLKVGNFTFLGFREYNISQVKGKPKFTPIKKDGLGILRNDDFLLFDGIRNAKDLPKQVYQRLNDDTPVIIIKANKRSRVHRPVYIDVVGLKKYNAAGKVIGIRLFAGLFTAECYSQSTTYIPYLKTKVQTIVDRSGFEKDSHSEKTLRHILETYPRDELFQISLKDLERISMGIMRLRHNPTVDIFVRNDTLHRFFSCMVYVPREDFDTALRLKFTDILENGLKGKCIDYYIQVDENSLARVQYIIKVDGHTLPKYNLSVIREKLYQASRDWDQRLFDTAVDFYGEEKATELLTPLKGAFSAAYREEMPLRSAIRDIEWVNLANAGEMLQAKLFENGEEEEGHAHFKIYKKGEAASLSSVLPILRNMGFQIVTEHPYEIRTEGHEPVWIHEFYGKIEMGETQTIKTIRFDFEEAFIKAWNEEIEKDRFNILILRAGFSWREANLMRSYAKFLRQAGYAYRNTTMANILGRHANITQKLCTLFKNMHDPKAPNKARRETAAGLMVEIDYLLSKVSRSDEDKVLRSYMSLIRETLRTNYYHKDSSGNPLDYLVFKIKSENLEDVPHPRPKKEIFIYSPRFEAVHLRGGDIARGGIRWSDRYDDFRTEILGLIKAQIVKNSVIVPVGSKGGFICKHLNRFESWPEKQAEAIECYKTMMRGMLSITDNIVKGKIVAPKNTVRLDDNDPYLVVAADKGTATFSDIANGISQEFGFWLDDAFASGGSKGYDHKAMGITARGAWESVKRHFRELGKDIQNQPFTVIGVGDMSGDVFGNGMLLSKQIKLIAAFDHRNIFIDPDPNTAKSYKERKRLFDNPRLTWNDYNRKHLSKGGYIFNRHDKVLTLTKEIQKLFELPSKTISPNEFMHKILQHNAELMWFGGIGTYIKASHQSHGQAGDKANDAIRVDANQVRAKVIGEGANLGVTQEARIEFSMKGGKVNTDFIDNSAGVDTSDHEVNLKIMLNQLVASKKISLKQRDTLLVKMEDEVGEHVLKNNYDQSLALTMVEHIGKARLTIQAELIRDLEKAGYFDRRIENLPDDETLKDMAMRGGQLTRPELSIILSYSKIQLFNEILASNLPDEKLMQSHLTEYFPTLAQKKFPKDILRHKLGREIIATEVVNVMINRMGPAFVKAQQVRTGAQTVDITRGFLITRECYNLKNIWAQIDALDNKIPANIQLDMYMGASTLLRHSVKWFLMNHKAPISYDKLAPLYRKGIDQISKEFDKILPESVKQPIEKRYQALREYDAVSPKLARIIAGFPMMVTALDIIHIANQSKQSLKQVGKVYFALDDRFKFNALVQGAKDMTTESSWARDSQSGLIDDLYKSLSLITLDVVKTMKTKENNVNEKIENWITNHALDVSQIDRTLSDIERLGSIDVHILSLMAQRLRTLAG